MLVKYDEVGNRSARDVIRACRRRDIERGCHNTNPRPVSLTNPVGEFVDLDVERWSVLSEDLEDGGARLSTIRGPYSLELEI